jgi:D-arabinan endo alpha-(1,5)-arabinofuranosidase
MADAKATDVIPAHSGASVMLGVGETGLLNQLTGPNSVNQTASRWGVDGTDLGHMFWHRDHLYMVFGDTFGKGGRRSGTGWRSNALALLSEPDLEQGLLRIESMITGPDGQARELIPSQKVDGVEKTVIPTNGVSTGDRMFLHYMSVQKWKQDDRWDVGHSGLAYSDDDGETWTVSKTAVWPGGSGFEQVAFLREGDQVYSFGIPAGRYGDVHLRRVASARMLDPSAYEYWDGSGWVADPGGASTVVAGPVGELSVAWNAGYHEWMMMYLNPERKSVVLRTSPEITGTWGPERVVVTANDHPGLYAPYIVPLPDIGKEVYFTMSMWKPYNVFLMRTTLARRDEASDDGSSGNGAQGNPHG